jgi:hypothetical protein
MCCKSVQPNVLDEFCFLSNKRREIVRAHWGGGEKGGGVNVLLEDF